MRCGTQVYCIDADIFGWVCRTHPDLDLPLREVSTAVGLRRRLAQLTASSDETLLPDGTLTAAGVTTCLPTLAGATAYVVMPGLVAATIADSHRLRIVVQRQELL